LYSLHSIYPSLLEEFIHAILLLKKVRQHILKVNVGEENEDKYASLLLTNAVGCEK
jgi:hypothetical protein